MSHSLLEVKDLSAAIHHDKQEIKLLKKISFSVQQGETLALVGESGSGKTLTILAIMQLLPAAIVIDSSSTILLQNEDLLRFSELKMRTIRGRKIAIVFQEAITALNPVLTIREQITEVLKQHFKMSKKEVYHKTLSLLKEVGI